MLKAPTMLPFPDPLVDLSVAIMMASRPRQPNILSKTGPMNCFQGRLGRLVLLITEDDVKELMDMRRTIHSLESAFSFQSQGHVQMPNRQVMKEEGSSAVVRVIPASVPGLKALGVKLLL